jgi:hypothetical protein
MSDEQEEEKGMGGGVQTSSCNAAIWLAKRLESSEATGSGAAAAAAATARALSASAWVARVRVALNSPSSAAICRDVDDK